MVKNKSHLNNQLLLLKHNLQLLLKLQVNQAKQHLLNSQLKHNLLLNLCSLSMKNLYNLLLHSSYLMIS